MSPDEMLRPEPEIIPADKMTTLVEMSNRAGQLEAEIEQLDEELGEKNKELQSILGGWQQPGLLVTFLQECGVSDITLLDGTRVVVNEELKAPSMAAGSKYREIVIDWAKKNGHGGAVKGEVTVNVPVGKEALADEILKFATEVHGLQGKKFETINSQTLAALLRELLEAGADVPLDQIGAFVFRQAEILKAKVKR
jgi:hypothetical protein